MRFAIIGRTEWLLEAGKKLIERGHELAIVVSCKEAPEYKATVEDFAALAKEWGVPFVRTISAAKIAEALGGLGNVPLGLSINFSGVLPESVTSFFSIGLLNVHVGDLPRFRGNACAAWAILTGENGIGLCVHKMVGGELDSGDIVGFARMDIDNTTKITEVNNWMEEVIPGLVADSVDRLAADPAFKIRSQSKDPRDALRCYPRRAEDGRINWRDSAIHILRLINASNRPYSGAFFTFEGQTVKVWHAELVQDGEIFLAVPGQVTAIGAAAIEVATGEGKVRISQLELDEAPVEPRDLVRSMRARLG